MLYLMGDVGNDVFGDKPTAATVLLTKDGGANSGVGLQGFGRPRMGVKLSKGHDQKGLHRVKRMIDAFTK